MCEFVHTAPEREDGTLDRPDEQGPRLPQRGPYKHAGEPVNTRPEFAPGLFSWPAR